MLTANRVGWFEFRLCNIDDMEEATQECLDKVLLSVNLCFFRAFKKLG